MTSRKRQICKS